MNREELTGRYDIQCIPTETSDAIEEAGEDDNVPLVSGDYTNQERTQSTE